MIDVIKVEHNQALFTNIKAKDKVEASFSEGENKTIFLGFPQITILKKSWKFGDQLQFSCYIEKEDFETVTKERNDSPYNRVEIYMPLDLGKQILEKALKELEE